MFFICIYSILRPHQGHIIVYYVLMCQTLQLKKDALHSYYRFVVVVVVVVFVKYMCKETNKWHVNLKQGQTRVLCLFGAGHGAINRKALYISARQRQETFCINVYKLCTSVKHWKHLAHYKAKEYDSGNPQLLWRWNFILSRRGEKSF